MTRLSKLTPIDITPSPVPRLSGAPMVLLDSGVYILLKGMADSTDFDEVWHCPITTAGNYDLRDACATDIKQAEEPDQIRLAMLVFDVRRGDRAMVVLGNQWWAMFEGDTWTGPIDNDGRFDFAAGRALEESDYGSSASTEIAKAEAMLNAADVADQLVYTPPADPRRAWDDSFKKTIVRDERSERRVVFAKDQPSSPFVVGQIPDESEREEALMRRHSGDLMTGVPSLFLATPFGGDYSLTWEEAYNLGQALIGVAQVSLHG